VNGLWLPYGPRHLRRPFAFARAGDPVSGVLSTPAPFQSGTRAGDEESFCRVIDPQGTVRAPDPRRRSFRRSSRSALLPPSSRSAVARAVRRLHRWSRASVWLPCGTTSCSRWLPLPLLEATTAVHTGEAPRFEVIGPSAHASSPCELARTRRSRSPPNEATSTPSSSSDDHREWVVPSVFSADPGVPPAPGRRRLGPGFPPGAFHLRARKRFVREAGASRAEPSLASLLSSRGSCAGFPVHFPLDEPKGDASFTPTPARP
jgi:hypothetical protein